MSVPMVVNPKNKQLFAEKYKIDGETGCWVWQAATNRQGYGIVSVNHKSRLAHRVSYWIANGPFDESFHLMHHCDNPLCVNPSHLQLCTNTENHQDRILKGRARDSQRKRADLVLNPDAVAQIKLRLTLGTHSGRQLAKLFGVSQSSIQCIKTERLWADVPPALELKDLPNEAAASGPDCEFLGLCPEGGSSGA